MAVQCLGTSGIDYKVKKRQTIMITIMSTTPLYWNIEGEYIMV